MCVNIRTDSEKTVKFNSRPRNLFLVTLFTFKRNVKQAGWYSSKVSGSLLSKRANRWEAKVLTGGKQKV